MPDELQTCPHCHQGHPPGTQTCPVTGQFLICPKCRHKLRSRFYTCPYCWHILSPVAPVSPQAEVPPTQPEKAKVAQGAAAPPIAESEARSQVNVMLSVQELVEAAQKQENSRDLHEALATYQQALTLAKEHQLENPALSLTVQMLTHAIGRTEQMIALASKLETEKEEKGKEEWRKHLLQLLQRRQMALEREEAARREEQARQKRAAEERAKKEVEEKVKHAAEEMALARAEAAAAEARANYGKLKHAVEERVLAPHIPQRVSAVENRQLLEKELAPRIKTHPAKVVPQKKSRWSIVIGSLLLLVSVLLYIGIKWMITSLPLKQVIEKTATATSDWTDTAYAEKTAAARAVATATRSPAPTTTRTPAPTFTPTPGIGSTWTRPADRMVMVYVPEGKFTMGSINGERDEQPVHPVDLDAFWLDKTEVTNAMYTLCVQAGTCQLPQESRSHRQSSYYGNSQYADYPVIYVDWNDAQTYCNWVGGRLPTEAEWEKAAVGTGRTYPWGNSSPSNNLLNFNENVGDTSTVGSYPFGASPYGALDMAGNVWEWVADWYGETYYESSPSSNPTGSAPGQYRVLRGSSWGSTGVSVRSANRIKIEPDVWYDDLGFRCAFSP